MQHYYYDNGSGGRPQGVKYTKADIASDDLYGRIAASKESQPAAQAILVKYGYDQAQTESQLAHRLASVVMNVGETALRDIANIHPDKELILSFSTVAPVTIQPVQTQSVSAPTKDLNDCGCGHHNASGGEKCGGKKHMHDAGQFVQTAQPSAFASATQASTAPVDDIHKYMKPALIIGVSALLVALVWKIK